ncbi:ER lumen protein-retaining receptor-like [Musa acuminata AAA Group]|uniref:ER lumen protein-retaining receptor-like n=1 Tax=Musa acuminata AAA Group TaxID=214697 RepID=UPI0031D7B03A
MPCVLISFFMTGYGDILPIFGSSCNTSSAGIVAKDKKYRQLDCSICFLLGAYRAFDILNWIYRYFTEPHCVHWITWIPGLAQTLLYADFFYYYLNSWKNNVKLKLPA